MSFISELSNRIANIFGNQRGLSREEAVAKYGPQGILLGGGGTKSNQNVTVETSFGIPALWAGFRILGQTMASLPFEVFERKADGDFHAEDHPAYDLLSRAPNELYNSFSFKEMMQVNLESHGNAYARIHRRSRVVDEIEWLDPMDVTVMVNVGKRMKKYKVRTKDAAGNAKELILDHQAMIHLMIMSKDGIIGRSPINACKEALGMMMAAQEYGAEFFAKGAMPSGVLTTEQNLKPEQVSQISADWARKYQGAANSGQVAILHSGNKYQQISATPVDADFVKTMKWTGEQICQMLGVPPHLLGILERSTNNNIEQQSIDFVVHCIRPRAKAWEVEFNTKLFLDPALRKQYYVRFNLDSLLRGDTAARGDFYVKMFNIGAMNRDEIRAHERMNRIPGGDKFFIPLNMADAEHINDKPVNNVQE